MINTLFAIIIVASNPTYTKDIKPIFEKRCSRCHSEKVQPHLNWLDYNIAFKYKDSIRKRVYETKTMPPGLPMSDQERELIRDWVDSGARK